MADEGEGEDRNEVASEQRLQHAYDEGQVPVGPAVTAAASLAAVAATLISVAAPLRDDLVELVQTTVMGLPTTSFSTLLVLLGRIASRAVLILASGVAVSIAVTFAQTRGGFWPDLALPNLERLVRVKTLLRPFTREFATDLAVGLVKVLAVGGVTVAAARDTLLTLPGQMNAPTGQLLTLLFGGLAHAGLRGLFALAVMAGLDLALSHHRFHQRMRMTRDEIKRERRENDGDPLMRRRRRRAQRALLKNQARIEVPKADALIVNPTHFAIAVRYRSDEGRAPRVVAKGKDVLAEYIRELARDNGVPIIEDIPLARMLFKKVKVGHQVPAETYRAVAVILAQVYRLTGRKPGARA